MMAASACLPAHVLDAQPPSPSDDWHDADWWSNHWSRTELVDVEITDAMPNGHEAWLHWYQARQKAGRGGPNTASDIQVLSEDAGRYMGILRIIGRRHDQPSAMGAA